MVHERSRWLAAGGAVHPHFLDDPQPKYYPEEFTVNSYRIRRPVSKNLCWQCYGHHASRCTVPRYRPPKSRNQNDQDIPKKRIRTAGRPHTRRKIFVKPDNEKEKTSKIIDEFDVNVKRPSTAPASTTSSGPSKSTKPSLSPYLRTMNTVLQKYRRNDISKTTIRKLRKDISSGDSRVSRPPTPLVPTVSIPCETMFFSEDLDSPLWMYPVLQDSDALPGLPGDRKFPKTVRQRREVDIAKPAYSQPPEDKSILSVTDRRDALLCIPTTIFEEPEESRAQSTQTINENSSVHAHTDPITDILTKPSTPKGRSLLPVRHTKPGGHRRHVLRLTWESTSRAIGDHSCCNSSSSINESDEIPLLKTPQSTSYPLCPQT